MMPPWHCLVTRVLTLSGVPHVIIVSCPSYRSPGVILSQPLIGQTLTMLSSHWLSLIKPSVQVLVTQPLYIRCLTPSQLSVVYTNVTWPLIGQGILDRASDWSSLARQTCFCTRLSPHSFPESSSETQRLRSTNEGPVMTDIDQSQAWQVREEG